MLNSVQQYVKGIITNAAITTTDYPGGVNVYIAPPMVDTPTTPTVYIWGSTYDINLQTAPRIGGYFKVNYEVSIWTIVPDQPDYSGADYAFPVVIDALTQLFCTTPMPVVITDPQTNFETQIISVGVKLSGEYAPVMQLGDQAWVYYSHEHRLHIEEKVQYV